MADKLHRGPPNAGKPVTADSSKPRKEGDRDQLEMGQRKSAAKSMQNPLASGLLTDAPSEKSLSEQRNELVSQIAQVQATLEYMGTGHPKKEVTEKELARLQALLAQVDRAIALLGPSA